MGIFGGGGDSGYIKPKQPRAPGLVVNTQTQKTPQTPYKMDLGQLANYQALQIRRLFEGPKVPNNMPKV